MRSKVTFAQFAAEIMNLNTVLDRTRRIALQKTEILNRVQGAAQAREMARFLSTEKPDSPAALERAAGFLVQARVSAQLRDDLRAVEIGSRLKPDSTIAVGRVLGARGRPAAGLRITMATDNKVAIAEDIVDSSGLFVLETPRAEFERRVAGAHELIVSVLDASGRLLREARSPVRAGLAATLVFNFDITSSVPAPRSGIKIKKTTPSLADIEGLTSTRIAKLREAGFGDLAALAEATEKKISSLLRIKADQAGKILKQARDLLARE